MDNQKITVSLEEVNSSSVDNELHRQDISQRMAEHQEKIRINFGGSGEMLGVKGGLFRQAMVYMAIFGMVASLLAWGVGEFFEYKSDKHPWTIASSVVNFLFREYPNATNGQFKEYLANFREIPEYRNNYFLSNEFWFDISKEQRTALIEKARNKARAYNILWYVSLATIIAIGLSIAESSVSKNKSAVIKNGIFALALGAIGGIVVSLFIDKIYNALGGGGQDTIYAQQIFARAVGWGILGLFVAIAPGIVMRSWKKIMLGCAGGLIGGLLGGALFDPICELTHHVVLARMVNILGLGVGAAIATVLLENIAKQGWLKVAAGVITGKQFILYRNPTLIGSSPKCEIYLFKDPSVAPKHAAINNRNGDFIVTGIEGRTVMVNNAPVRQQILKSGDQLRIGNTVFIFEARKVQNQ